VAITISEERGVRYLHFASPWIQGAMRIARPYRLELEYTRDLMLPLLLRPSPEWPRSVLQIGLGPASVTKFLYRFRPSARITVVEILPQVVAAAFQYFRLPDDSDRIRIEIGDAHDFVGRSRARFDFIILDGFDDKGRAGLLDTAPFYMNCRERLTTRGMVAVNLLTRQRGVNASIERLQLAFDDRVLQIPPCEAGNAVAIAAVGEEVRESFDDLRATARALKTDSGLDLLPTLGRIASASSAQDAVVL
jgi:spermidine synthase